MRRPRLDVAVLALALALAPLRTVAFSQVAASISGVVTDPNGAPHYRDGPAFSPRGIVDTDGVGLVDQRDLAQPRNRCRVDDVVTLDLRAEKLFSIGGAHSLALLVEAFNLTNEDNVATVNNVSGPAFGTPSSFLPGREIQLGARWFLGGR